MDRDTVDRTDPPDLLQGAVGAQAQLARVQLAQGAAPVDPQLQAALGHHRDATRLLARAEVLTGDCNINVYIKI